MKYAWLAGLLLSGCAGVPESYRAADRATYEAIAPEFVDYVESDESLSESQKRHRRLTVETWRLRLEEAEE